MLWCIRRSTPRETMRFILLTVVLLWITLTTEGMKLCEKKCYFGQPCMATVLDWTKLAESLDGDFIWPDHPLYATLNTMKNMRVKTDPMIIAFVNNAEDVQKCVNMTKKFNIRVSIMSSGHSYIGRSVSEAGFLINLSKMKGIEVNLDRKDRSEGGEVTVESGATWVKVYEEVDKYGRIVVGGSAHTVAMGGYTQGGGHSPLSRYLGLAVDNLLEVKLVTAEGHLVTTNAKFTFNHNTGENSTNTDLFWALRGGGGGTWGVVISFTFKLHIPPSGFVQYTAGYAMYYNNIMYGNSSLQNVLKHLERLPKEWGGYVVMSTAPSPTPGVNGWYILSLLHYGPWGSESFHAIDELSEDIMGGEKTFHNKTSFWDYEKTVSDADLSPYRSYIVNSLIQPGKSGGNLANVITEELFMDPNNGTGCTFTMLGGAMEEPGAEETPINPGFRSAKFSLSCGRTWVNVHNDKTNIDHANRFGSRLQEFGGGVYFNEPAEHLDNWKTAFWGKGGKYDKLLNIKKTWDPTNFFCCHNCVGFDLEEKPDDDQKPCPSSSNKLIPAMVVVLLVSLVWIL